MLWEKQKIALRKRTDATEESLAENQSEETTVLFLKSD